MGAQIILRLGSKKFAKNSEKRHRAAFALAKNEIRSFFLLVVIDVEN